MAFQPIQITRIDADHYRVGRVDLIRRSDGWTANPVGDIAGRPMFTAPTLEGILDMAHGACEMMRPADAPSCWNCGGVIPAGHGGVCPVCSNA